MRCTTRVLFLAFWLASLPTASQAKSADGVVVLEGKISNVETGADAVTFQFTGRLRFTFFNAARNKRERRQVDLSFDVEGLPVRIPDFGGHEFDNEDCSWRVTFKNAGLNAKGAAHSGEAVSVMLFEPKFSYDLEGVIERIDSARGQVLTDRLNHDLRGFEKRCQDSPRAQR